MHILRLGTGLLLAVGAVSLQAADVAAAPINPVAYYSFDDNVTTGNDNSGNGNHATLGNGAAYMAGGQSGGALSLPNENSSMLINTPVDIDNVGWTVAAWYKDLDTTGFRTFFRGQGNDHQLLLESGSNRLGMFANGHGNFRPATPQFVIPDDLVAAPADGWHHVAAVGTGGNAGQIDFYVDGAFAGTADEGSETDIWSIGAWGNGQRFSLAIDEVYIYQRALTAGEVGELFNPIPEPSSFILAALGMLCLGISRRRRRR